MLAVLYPIRGLDRCVITSNDYRVTYSDRIESIGSVLDAVARDTSYDQDFRILVAITHNMLDRKGNARVDADTVLNRILRLGDAVSYVCRECVPGWSRHLVMEGCDLSLKRRVVSVDHWHKPPARPVVLESSPAMM